MATSPPPANPTPPLPGAEVAARKRLFIGLIVATCAAVCLFLVLFWIVPYVGLANLHPVAPWVLGAVVLAIMAMTVWAGLGLVLNILTGRSFPFFKRLRGLTVKLFLPLMTLIGRLVGIDKERIRSSFIKVNNELVLSEAHRRKPEEILLLMPHCLQSSTCDMRLTYDVDNCKRCGKCPIAGLLDLRDRYGVHLAIATGGTIARRIVVQKRPAMIIAVACERDLSAGIQDTYPLPVYGVLNMRPHGPCLDTLVPFDQLEAALCRFLDTNDARPSDQTANESDAPDSEPTTGSGRKNSAPTSSSERRKPVSRT